MPSLLPWLLIALQQNRPEPPRLVVIVAVDQLIPEQLQRLAPELDGGLGRFLREGAVFWRALVDYSATETGPGHATLATGRYPASHGIVGNLYLDRGTGKVVYCTADEAAHPLTGAGVDAKSGSSSPARLIGEAFGDLLEQRVAGSKTVTVTPPRSRRPRPSGGCPRRCSSSTAHPRRPGTRQGSSSTG